jgi:cobalt-precorrin-5B (C1)-methyltransferase
MKKELKSGYTTGTHATALLVGTLYEYYKNSIVKSLEVTLPKNKLAIIDVKRKEKLFFSSIKTDNDDLDVTKGCEITLKLLSKAPQNLKKQIPSLLKINKTKIYIYAGDGIGVVSKKGLKIEPNYPAINPIPLNMMIKNSLKIIGENDDIFHAVFSVVDGQNIAKQTANEKVGVLGGISILGTRGIVKPISAEAYLDSIEAEVSVANACGAKIIVFTLGNTAHDYANENYDKSIVVEVGNFVFDGASRLKNTGFEKMIFISSIAKMCKVAQECKNTHNRFGGIDFDKVRSWLEKELNINLDLEEFLTLKAVLKTLSIKNTKKFSAFLGYKSAKSFKKWFNELNIDIKHIEIITLNGSDKVKRELKW